MFEWMDAYAQIVTGNLLIQTLLVLSLFVVFQCGVLSLGSIGFMAVGSYTAALCSLKLGWPTPLCVAAGALVAGLVAFIFGRLVLHLRGIYLALGTFALGQVCVLLIAELDFAGGYGGLVGIPRDVGLTTLLIVLIVVAVIFQLVHRSRVGRALRAMRLDDRVAAGVGVNTARYRNLAFMASGLLAGLAGALDAFRNIAVSPDQFNFTLLVQILAVAMIGGAYHWSGAVAAAIVIGFLHQWIGLAGALTQGFLYGGLLVVVMLLLPEGIVNRQVVRWLTRRRRKPQVLTPEVIDAGNGVR